MLQAGINSVYYIHEWIPNENSKDQYETILKSFPGGVHKINIEDTRHEWAVRVKTEISSTDETGHSSS